MMNVRQKIMLMVTDKGQLRSNAQAWNLECGATAERDAVKRISVRPEYYTTQNQVPVGLLGSPSEYHMYPTPLHAMADGWRLMNQPNSADDGYEWWFEKIAMAQDPFNIPGDM